jgi:hypothetical protein
LPPASKRHPIRRTLIPDLLPLFAACLLRPKNYCLQTLIHGLACLLVPMYSRCVFTTRSAISALELVVGWLYRYAHFIPQSRASCIHFLGTKIALHSPQFEPELNSNSTIVPEDGAHD